MLGVTGPIITSAFVPSATFTRTVSTCVDTKNEICTKRTANHPTDCDCPLCTSSVSALSMSDATAEAEVPSVVADMDGVESEQEAHNIQRPARASGTAKHSRKEESGTPLTELEVGATVEGTVKAIVSFGAFLDIGAATDALCHVSRLSDEFVSDANDVVSVGEKFQVRIISVDTEKKQVAVTMRSEEAEANAANRGGGMGGGGRTKDRPRRSNGDREAQRTAMSALAEAGYDGDKFVEGEVQSTLAFGAFVRFSISDFGEGLEGEIDGLVHISALAEQRVNEVTDICKSGDKVQVRIKGIDAESGKVSLSMITKEQEPEPRSGGGRRSKQQFTEEEMGAKDWKEQLETFQSDMPTFKNVPFTIDRRK